MYEKILVPLDGSPFAENALPHALGLARHTGAVLHIVLVHHIQLPMEPAWAGPTDDYARSMYESEVLYLQDVRKRLERWSFAKLVMHHASGAPAHTIPRLAAELNVDIVIMSTHGRGGVQRAWLGSVADAVVRRARVPVLLVRPSPEATRPRLEPVSAHRVLVALDGSRVAEAALAAATELAYAEDATCTILRVVVPPMFISSYPPETGRLNAEQIESASETAEGYMRALETRVPGVDGAEVVVHAQPAEMILKYAEAHEADLIALGSRGMGRIARLFIGSVADKVVRGAHVPVLVSPTPTRRLRQQRRAAAAAAAKA